MVYFTQMVNLPVVDAQERTLGRLRDLVIEPSRDRNLVQMVVYRGGGNLWQVPVTADEVEEGRFRLLRSGTPEPFQTNTSHLLLRRDVLDQQIIDVNGRKVVRVNDVGLEVVQSPGGRELRALAVEVGVAGALRRLGQGAMPTRWLQPMSGWVKPRLIPWQAFDLVETDAARRMHLQITYKALGKLHPADAADIVEELTPAEGGAVLAFLDDEVAADILEEVSPRRQRALIEGLDTERAADILEEMEPDKAADVLADLPTQTTAEILQDMQAEERDEVADLLEYPEDTAGGRMTTQFLTLPDEATVGQAIESLRRVETHELESLHAIFLVNPREELVGTVPVARLLVALPNQNLRALAADPISVRRGEREEEVAALFDKYNLLALPVVDEQLKVVGVITVDDVIAWLRKG